GRDAPHPGCRRPVRGHRPDRVGSQLPADRCRPDAGIFAASGSAFPGRLRSQRPDRGRIRRVHRVAGQHLHRSIWQSRGDPGGTDVRYGPRATTALDPVAMAVALCAMLAVGYVVGGRRPVRVVDAPTRWNGRRLRAIAFFTGLVLLALAVTG